MTQLEIVPYDPDWPARFAAERDRLTGALGPVAVRIDHVGSTSVPGLAAKDIVDIQVSVEVLHPMDGYRDPLEALGYLYQPHGDPDPYPFFGWPVEWPRRFHVHVCEAGSTEEARHLAFAAALRADPALAAAYESLKRGLASQFSAEDPAEREAYAEAKSPFIDHVVPR